jgi:Na+-driven multidrug efflux pump
MGSGLLTVLMLCLSAAILIWAEHIIRIFSSDPELIRVASAFIRIAAVGNLLVGFNTSLQQCISGAGDTVPPMLITLLNLWLVQVPLAFILSRNTSLAVYGVRWAMASGGVGAALAYLVYFRSGRWKTKKV